MTSTEKILWNYRRNVKEKEELGDLYSEMESVYGHSYEVHGQNVISDPVFETVKRKLRAEEKITRLEREIKAVEKLKEKLPPDEMETYQMGQILRYRYINHLEAVEVMRQVGMSKSTYWKRKVGLLRLADKYVNDVCFFCCEAVE